MIMHKKFAVLISIILLFTFTKIGMTEPTPTIRRLMNEPVTMLDWGMYRLEQKLICQESSLVEKLKEEIKEKKLDREKIDYPLEHPVSIGVVYNWDSNRIEINIDAGVLHKFKNKQKAKFWCTLKIDYIKNILGINPKTGEPELSKFIHIDSSMLDSYFQHEGFMSESESKNLGKELDNITEISVKAYYLEGKETKMVHYRSPLRSTKIFFSE